jgi:putative transcriptional regulator
MDESTLLSDLGKRIRMIRLTKNMTQYQLAINCNFEKSSMSKIESGQVNLSYLTLYRISKGLDVHIRELLPETKK